jgi:hypothetical protein
MPGTPAGLSVRTDVRGSQKRARTARRGRLRVPGRGCPGGAGGSLEASSRWTVRRVPAGPGTGFRKAGRPRVLPGPVREGPPGDMEGPSPVRGWARAGLVRAPLGGAGAPISYEDRTGPCRDSLTLPGASTLHRRSVGDVIPELYRNPYITSLLVLTLNHIDFAPRSVHRQRVLRNAHSAPGPQGAAEYAETPQHQKGDQYPHFPQDDIQLPYITLNLATTPLLDDEPQDGGRQRSFFIFSRCLNLSYYIAICMQMTDAPSLQHSRTDAVDSDVDIPNGNQCHVKASYPNWLILNRVVHRIVKFPVHKSSWLWTKPVR